MVVWSALCDDVEGERKRNVPLRGNGKLPGPGTRLHDNVGLLDAALEKLGLGAGDERLDDGGVPAGVDDADAQAGAVVLLGGRALERHDVLLARKKGGYELLCVCCRGRQLAEGKQGLLCRGFSLVRPG